MKRIQRTGAAVLCALLALFMILPMNVSAAGNSAGSGQTPAVLSETDQAKDSQTKSGQAEGGQNEEDSLARIVLSVGDGQETPLFKAEEKTKLQINITNKGNVDAQNVTISPIIKNVDEWPFDISRLNNDLSLGTIKAGEQAAAVWGSDKDPLTVRSDVSGKSYQLTFAITYDDGTQAYQTEKYVFVKTEAKPAEDNGGTTTPPADNSGSGSGTGTDAGSSDLGAGGIYNSDPISTGGSATDGSVPRVIVTGFDTNPTEVRAGSNFKLIIHLKNTSAKTAVSNMLFDLQAPSSGTGEAAEAPAFLPTSGSSTIYLDGIAAGGTQDISIDLNARADLIQKPYSITMTMQYEDSSASQFEAQSSLAIPVTQEARFEFSELQISPDTVSVGEEANITCNLYNLGRVKMYNVKARFEGDAIESQEQFIGNLDSGATGVIDGIVTAIAESYDESNCKLVLTYEDDAGNLSTVEQEFTMTVTAMEEPMDMEMMMEMPEETTGPSIPMILGIIAVVIVLAAVIVTVVLKKRKKKIQEEEEEELMDEVERFTEDEREQP